MRYHIIGACCLAFTMSLLFTSNTCAQMAPPFHHFVITDSGAELESPGSDTGTAQGVFAAYCLRIADFKQLDNVSVSQPKTVTICSKRTDDGLDRDPLSMDFTFPQLVIQIQKCWFDEPLEEPSADLDCGSFETVKAILTED